jgi:transposase
LSDVVLFGDDDQPSVRAFARAQELRSVRTRLANELRSGELTLAELFDLEQRDPRVSDVKAVVLLEVLPGIGKVAARKALANVGRDESVRLGQLEAGAREQLARILSRSVPEAGLG